MKEILPHILFAKFCVPIWLFFTPLKWHLLPTLPFWEVSHDLGKEALDLYYFYCRPDFMLPAWHFFLDNLKKVI